MSSLLNERPIVISPALAATIGLEEAILLSLLQDFALLRDRHQDWQEVLLEEIQQLAPFWAEDKLRALAENLEQKGIIQLETPKLQPNLRLRFSLHSGTVTTASKSSVSGAKTSAAKTARAQPLNTLWQPDEQTLKVLEKNHGITRDFALAQVDEFRSYWAERGEAKHAWNNNFQKDVLRKWRNREVEQAQTEKAKALDYGWRPSDDAITILTRAGVDAEFLEEAIPEFVLYWRERGQASHTWNSKFIAHIRKQWAKYTAEMQTDGEPKLIEKNWQPSANVFDILKMANIDVAFGHAQVSEFILYWQERGEAHSAWNSKFLQHVKQQWAYSHLQQQRLEQANEAQRQNSRSATDKRGFIEKHTDLSWMDGLK
jgi:hypothetical protein